MAADRGGGEAGEGSGAGGSRRTRAGLCNGGDDRRLAGHHGAQHRLLHDRRSSFRRSRRDGSQHARGDGPRPEPGMIIGIGSDLIDITRVGKVIDRHGERFLDRIFTAAERAKAERRAKNEKMVVATYAKRFAAKEACSKALGTGIRRGVWWRDMGVVNLPSGQPTMVLTGGAAERLKALMPAGMEPFIHLSLTDDHPYAQAFVVIEARPRSA